VIVFALGWGAGRWGTVATNADPQATPIVVESNDGQTVDERRWPTVRLVVDDSGEPIELPVYDASEINPNWFESQPRMIPAHVRDALERQGYRVDERRRVYPVATSDGRKVLMPVEEADVTFTADRPFQ
jgi:hypothetical protein